MAEHLRFEREAQDDAGQACCEPERDLQRPARFVDCAERPHERPAARFGAAGRLDDFDVWSSVARKRLGLSADVNCLHRSGARNPLPSRQYHPKRIGAQGVGRRGRSLHISEKGES